MEIPLEGAGEAPMDGIEPEPEPEGSQDEMKRRFKEALERKRQAQSETAAGGRGKGSAKIHGAHGPAASRRSFRRKSGG